MYLNIYVVCKLRKSIVFSCSRTDHVGRTRANEV